MCQHTNKTSPAIVSNLQAQIPIPVLIYEITTLILIIKPNPPIRYNLIVYSRKVEIITIYLPTYKLVT